MRFALAFAALAAFTMPAHAALQVCNKTAKPTRVAVGRFDGTAWISEGWWTLAPAHCDTLVPGKLNARYYYLYASDGGAGSWDGSRDFCVTASDKFQIHGRGHCEIHGFDRKGFFSVDTHDKTDFTQILSD